MTAGLLNSYIISLNALEREVCVRVCLKRKPLDVFVLLFVLCLEGNDAIKGTKQTGVIMPEDPSAKRRLRSLPDHRTVYYVIITAIRQSFPSLFVLPQRNQC